MDFLGFKNFGYNDNEHEKLIKEYPSLYHYTTKEAFSSILKTKSLWATNCQYLKDTSETTHIIPILEKIANEQDLTKSIYTRATISSLSWNLERERKLTYVICFSKDENSNTMWKHDNKINDLNIEFDTVSIDKKLSRSGLKIIDVPETIYTNNIILNNITYISSDLENYIRVLNNRFNNERLRKEKIIDGNTENITNIFSLSLQWSIFTKSRKYINENEIRAAFVLMELNYKKAEKYRTGEIPYLDVSFEENGKLPIKSIIINPDRSSTKDNIEDLLKSYNYDIPVIVPERK